ncbi:MAG TPA: outer membrane beta-barrel protein [Afipia sp.]
MVMMAGAVQGAQAADYPDDAPILRGSFRDGLSTPRPRNWSGYYAGGQVGYSSANVDFSNAQSGMTSFLLRNTVEATFVPQWSLFGKNDIQATSFGGFIGRNWQWSDAVLGVEVNYNHFSNLRASTSNSMGRSVTNPPAANPPTGHSYTYDVALAGSAAVQVHDVMTFRARAAWSAGNFLPYMFGGLAVGRMDSFRSVTINEQRHDDYFVDQVVGGVTISVPQRDTVTYAPIGQTESRNNNFVAGYTAGLGTEMMLFGNVFGRVEWEYVKFLKIKDISIATNTVRAGLGYKF